MKHPAPRLVRTRTDLLEVVQRVGRYGEFFFDVETTGLNVITNEVTWIGLAVPDYIALIPMGHTVGPEIEPGYERMEIPPDNERRVLKDGTLSKARTKKVRYPPTYGDPGRQLRQDEVFEALRPLFFSDRRIGGANVKFDLESIFKYYGELPPGPYHDTMLVTHTLDENLLQYNLKTSVMDWLRVSPNPKVRKEFYPAEAKGGITDVPLDRVARYLAKDVWYGLIYLRDHLRMLHRDRELTGVYELEMALYGPIMRMELVGICIDTDMLQERGAALVKERDAIAERAWEITGSSFELTNTNQKREFLFGNGPGCQGLKPLSYTEKTGTAQLNKATLEHYAPTNELARCFLDWTEKDKVISTYIVGMGTQLVDGKLHSNFKQYATVTARLSSSGPNLQNIPRGTMIRDAFVAEDGYVLVVSDFDQVELRCAAHLSRDPVMMEVFQLGLDIHREAAASMLQCAPEDVTSEQRVTHGKNQNFGALYGVGPQKVADTAGVSFEEAEYFIQLYYERFSGLNDWKAREIAKARRRGVRGSRTKVPYTKIPPTGRRRRLPDLLSDNFKDRARAERQVVNSIVQGFAANIMKLAFIDLDAALPDTGVDAKIVLNVHDEIVVQAPEAHADMIRDLVTAKMQGVTWKGEPILGEVPLTAESKIAYRWSEGK